MGFAHYPLTRTAFLHGIETGHRSPTVKPGSTRPPAHTALTPRGKEKTEMGIDPGSGDDVDLDSDGEAQRLILRRLILRRPFRWDRAGLFYFGRRYRGSTMPVTPRELAVLHAGREILIASGTEYLVLLRTTPNEVRS
jgi:hypothetical protein